MNHAPSSDITIVQVRASDAEVLPTQQLDARCFHDGERTDIAAECSRPFTSVWAAKEELVSGDARVVGYLVAWHVADELHILNVATDPEHRRRGIGSRLMDHAICFAREHGVRLLLLEVRESNSDALRLYQSLGFSSIGKRLGYYSDGENAVNMALSLESDGICVVPTGDVPSDMPSVL